MIWIGHGISGHHEKGSLYIKHKENKMPRAKKTSMRKSTSRKTTPRRKTSSRRRSEPGDVFWDKVVNGFKKLLSPAFPK
jgi:BRCT domain type II-containing protein